MSLKYLIWTEHHYYAGTFHVPKDDFVRDEAWAPPQQFASIDDAERWVREHTPTVHYLGHGEYARPDYTIMPLIDVDQDWERERTIYSVERDGAVVRAIADADGIEWEAA